MPFKPFLHQKLVHAAQTGNLAEVSRLLEDNDVAFHAGARFNAVLRAALYNNHQEIANKLLALNSVKKELIKCHGTHLLRLKNYLGYRALILALENERYDLSDTLIKLPLIKQQLLENKGEKLLRYTKLLGFEAFKLLMESEQTDLPYEAVIKQLLNNPDSKSLIIKNLKDIYLLAGTKIPKWKLMSVLLHELPNDTFLPLVNDPHLISNVKSYAQVFLLDVFRLSRKFEKTPSTPLEMAYYARITSHLLGLSNKIKVLFAKSVITFDVAGLPLEPSLNKLTNLLKKYLISLTPTHPHHAIFSQIEEAFRFSDYAMPKGGSSYNANTFEEMAKRYHADKPLFLSSGWAKEPVGHGIGLAFMEKYIVYCNRGEASFSPLFGTHIFEIKDSSKITKDFLKKLDYLANSSFTDLKKTLSEVIDLDKPVVVFTSKSQEHPTCGFCNPKSTIEAMYFLCVHGKESPKDLEEKAAHWDRLPYKNFTKFVRDDALKEVIVYANAAETAESKLFMTSLLKNILLEHHGVSRTERKSGEELIRAQEILDNVRKEVQDALLQDQDLIPVLSRVRLHTLMKINNPPPKISQIPQIPQIPQTPAAFWAEKTKSLKVK